VLSTEDEADPQAAADLRAKRRFRSNVQLESGRYIPLDSIRIAYIAMTPAQVAERVADSPEELRAALAEHPLEEAELRMSLPYAVSGGHCYILLNTFANLDAEQIRAFFEDRLFPGSRSWAWTRTAWSPCWFPIDSPSGEERASTTESRPTSCAPPGDRQTRGRGLEWQRRDIWSGRPGARRCFDSAVRASPWRRSVGGFRTPMVVQLRGRRCIRHSGIGYRASESAHGKEAAAESRGNATPS